MQAEIKKKNSTISHSFLMHPEQDNIQSPNQESRRN